MTDRAIHHRRTHNLLLIQRLLSLREGTSPFTLILDSLEQSGRPLISEYIRRAKVRPLPPFYIPSTDQPLDNQHNGHIHRFRDLHPASRH